MHPSFLFLKRAKNRSVDFSEHSRACALLNIQHMQSKTGWITNSSCWAQRCVWFASPPPSLFLFHEGAGAAKSHSSTSLNEMWRCHLTYCLLQWVTLRPRLPYPLLSTLFSLLNRIPLPPINPEAPESIQSGPPPRPPAGIGHAGIWFCQYSCWLSFITGERHEGDWSTQSKTAWAAGDWIRTGGGRGALEKANIRVKPCVDKKEYSERY